MIIITIRLINRWLHLLVKCWLYDVELVGSDGASSFSQPTTDDRHRQLNSQLGTWNYSFTHWFTDSLNSQVADMDDIAGQRTQSTGDDGMRRYDRRDELTVHWQRGREPG